MAALKALNDSAYSKDLEVSIDLPTNSFFLTFYNQCEEIKSLTQLIKDNVDSIKSLHAKILDAPTADENVRNELDRKMNEIKSQAGDVKSKLKLIEKDVANMKSAGAPENAEFRIRKSQFTYLSHFFTSIMNEFNLIQVEHRNACKQRIMRQLDIAGKSTTDDEIEKMLESGNAQIFNENVLLETKIAKQTLIDIEERHKDILRLEKSIQELCEMFSEIAILIQAQGELIENIEKNVQATKDYVESAKTQTDQARVYQSKARRKKIILIVVLITVVLIVIAILIGVLYDKFKK